MSGQKIDHKILVEKLNSSLIFTSIAKSLEYKRIGLQILKDGKVIKEFTSYNRNGKIVKLEEGLNDPDLQASMEEEVIVDIIKKQEWIQKNPEKAMIEYKDKIELNMGLFEKLKLFRMLSEL